MCNACVGEDLILPCPTAEPKKKRLGKRQRASHSYQYLTKRKDGSQTRKAKDEETVVLSSSGFLGDIKAYLLDLTRADCFVTVRDKATSCKFLTFLADAPWVIKYAASLIQMYFNFDYRKRRHHIVSETRYADRIMRESKLGKSPKPYQLPMFTDILAGINDDREDIHEAMEKVICLSAWTTLFNVDRKQLEIMRSVVKAKQSMGHDNTGKHHIDEEKEDAYQNIIETLHDCEKQSTPFATRVVRDETSTSSL